MSTSDDTFPLDPVQDREWTAPRLVMIGAVTLLLALIAIYTVASTIGEQPNQFHHLEHTF